MDKYDRTFTFEEEVAYLDYLPSAQRKIYLEEVRALRGKEVEERLRAALLEYWKSHR